MATSTSVTFITEASRLGHSTYSQYEPGHRLGPVPRTLDFRMPKLRLQKSEPLSALERLPMKIQNIIFLHLDYQALIFLSTMNSFYKRVIDPASMATSADKFQFVMRAAKDFPQHRPREKSQGNFECYICYKIRGPDYFDWLQPQSVFVDEASQIVREPSM